MAETRWYCVKCGIQRPPGPENPCPQPGCGMRAYGSRPPTLPTEKEVTKNVRSACGAPDLLYVGSRPNSSANVRSSSSPRSASGNARCAGSVENRSTRSCRPMTSSSVWIGLVSIGR